MKDHPDEFLMQRKWDELINEFGGYFTEEELNAYKVARSEMMRDLFNEAVLKRLAGEEDDSGVRPSTAQYNAQGRYSHGWTDPKALFGQAVINTPSLAAKQANAAMQQQAYNAAIEQRPYSEQRGLQNRAGSLGNFISPF
jgi:hypothetical protein